jgi:hypothetical protein
VSVKYVTLLYGIKVDNRKVVRGKKEGAKQSKTKQQWKNIIINSLYSITSICGLCIDTSKLVVITRICRANKTIMATVIPYDL